MRSKTVIRYLVLCAITAHAMDETLCETSKDCEGISSTWSSSCIDGKCTTPFASGCLRAIARERNDTRVFKTRVCNSNDDESTSSSCTRPAPPSYGEVRIAAADWESTVVTSWIYQIILSELLDVPTTIEFGDGTTDEEGSFYDRQHRFIIGSISYPFELLKEADRLETAGQVCDSLSEPPCVHMMAEIWEGAYSEMKEAQGTLRGTKQSILQLDDSKQHLNRVLHL